MADRDNIANQLGTVTPYFTVENADMLIEFVIAVFGGCLVKENRYEDGKAQHARLRIGNSIIMLNQSTDEYPKNVSQIHLYVDDVEPVFENALQWGATSLMKPNLRPHGDRMAGIKDPCGNIWWIASQTS